MNLYCFARGGAKTRIMTAADFEQKPVKVEEAVEEVKEEQVEEKPVVAQQPFKMSKRKKRK